MSLPDMEVSMKSTLIFFKAKYRNDCHFETAEKYEYWDRQIPGSHTKGYACLMGEK